MYIRIVTFFLFLIDYINKRKILNFFKKNLKNEIDIFIDVGAHHAESIKLFNKLLCLRGPFPMWECFSSTC